MKYYRRTCSLTSGCKRGEFVDRMYAVEDLTIFRLLELEDMAKETGEAQREEGRFHTWEVSPD